MKKSILLASALLLTALSSPLFADQLDNIHQSILKKYTDVSHINADEYMQLDKDDIVIFDVREKKEHAVSRIDNATQVDPNISAEDFFAQFGDELDGKKAVFYCSVGRRSSKLLQRLEEKDDSFDLVNLEGGIFRWTNDKRDVSGQGVHPYNWVWSWFIEDRDKVLYSPVDPAKN